MSRASETSYGYTLRKELKPLQVYVSIFEPTNVSKITESVSKTAVTHLKDDNHHEMHDDHLHPPGVPTSPTISEMSVDSGIFSESSRTKGVRRMTEPDFTLNKSDRRRISLLIPCLKLSEDHESSDEVLDELVHSITNPVEPPLFISLKNSSFKYTL